MDVVRSNIEKIGGVIELESAVDKGTRFIIKIPLTLTIISALIMETSGERYAIPQLTVNELVRVSSRSQHQIDYVNKNPVLRLRSGLLPLIFLADVLGLPRDTKQDDYCVVVTNVGNIAYGIVVDRVFDIQEIVVKPLSKMLQNISICSGNTILGDGSIVMIIDPNTIANDLSHAGNRDMATEATKIIKSSADKSLLLIFRVREQFYAVPLAIVTRISEISTEQLEYINNTWLIKYSGHLLPIEKLEGEAPFDPETIFETPFNTPMLVFSDRGLAMGLVVDEIVTILEENLDVEIQNRKSGILGSTLIDGNTTSVIDCEFYLRKAHPDWFDHFAINSSTKKNRKIKTLLVDDSHFFRNLVIPVLSMSGFEIITAEDGEEGLKLCRSESDFDIIVSDIEMPNMDGFEMVKAVRALPTYKDTIVVALSSRISDSDIAHGKECGFNEHFSKSDQRGLVDYLNKFKQDLISKELLE
jgi:two-component system, chemotaxis family, sensor kinase CheA